MSDSEEHFDEHLDYGEDDERNNQYDAETFGHPYNSYSFAATAWKIRKNLTETFNKLESKEGSCSNGRKVSAQTQHPALQRVFSVSEKVAQYEQKTSESSSNIGALPIRPGGRPPRQLSEKQPNTTKSMSLVEKGCVSVYLRVRPPKDGLVNTIEILPGNLPTRIRTHAPERSNAAKIHREQSNNSLISEPPTVVREFEFQKIFGPQQKQEDLYAGVVAPMVKRMFPSSANIQPESGLLFAYGATNAGKTYSILGKLPTERRVQSLQQESHWGIVPRALQDLFHQIEQRKSKDTTKDFDLYLSYYEIYNENIYDLLAEPSSSNPIYFREPLKLRESRKQTFIRGLVRQKVMDVSEGLRYARLANSKRHTSSNNLNNGSSRSHCICQIQLVQNNRSDDGPIREESTVRSSSGYNTDDEANHVSLQRFTTLWVVDLAGSERSKRTNVGSLRQKEASLINKSLMNLMRCLTMMRENQSTETSNQIIPFRENKLTHLFMPIFTGKNAARVSMIVNVNPAAPDFDETNHVLSYASQARMVQIDQNQKVDPQKPSEVATEYGYDGRAVKQSKTAASKIKSFVKKLSPKKLMSKSKVHKKDQEKSRDKKRTASPLEDGVHSNAMSTSSQSGGDFKAKRMRLIKSNSNGAINPMENVSSEVSNISSNAANDGTKSLKMALSIAQAEIEKLRSEKRILVDKVSEVESQVRLEVSEEMEEQINQTKRHYQDIINGMKRRIRPSLSATERQARVDKASEQIDVLLFKIEECEEEMERMRKSHSEEVTAILKKSKEKDAAQKEEIEALKLQLREVTNAPSQSNGFEEKGNKDDTVLKLRADIERLQTSKQELISNYERLLNDAEDEEPDSGDDKEDEEADSDEDDKKDEEADNDEEGSPAKTVVVNKHQGSTVPSRNYMYRTRSKASSTHGRKASNRAPLSVISRNKEV